MKNELQASINLPSNVLDLAADENEIAPTIALRFPVKDKNGLLMNIQIADGKVEDEPATIMEMNSTATENIKMDLKNVLSILDDSQKILHSTFLEMTKNIEDRMKPTQHKE
jgi:exonuclease VII large subunit